MVCKPEEKKLHGSKGTRVLRKILKDFNEIMKYEPFGCKNQTNRERIEEYFFMILFCFFEIWENLIILFFMDFMHD